MPAPEPEKTAPLPRDPARRRDRDLCLWDPQTDTFFALDRRPRTLGKDPGCDVRLPHATVSRRHARVEWTGEGPVLVDLGSSNGLWTAGRRVDRAPLHAHGTVRLGAAPLAVVPAPTAGAAAERLGERFHTRSAGLCAVLALAEKVAPGGRPVLIAGETGTGKEWLARFLHDAGRPNGPLVPVNCGAIARDLLESELFGHARGAFTGADGPRAGLVSRAAGGTLFLDEIGELRPEHQAALLRFLENRTFRPVGSDKEQVSDARILAASHADLLARVVAGTFREDLLYRLLEIRLTLPPLRERLPDLPALLEVFDAPPPTERAWTRLLEHPWPGNLRELRHVAARARLEGWSAASEELRGPPEPALPEAVSAPDQLRELEREMVQGALARCGHNTSAAARALGLPRSTLVNRMKSLGI